MKKTTKAKLKKLIPKYAKLGMHNQNALLKLEKLNDYEDMFQLHAEQMCNCVINDDENSKNKSMRLEAIATIEEMLPSLKHAIHYNQDPRGYALKISKEHAEHIENIEGLTQDWGGDYIIAPNANI